MSLTFTIDLKVAFNDYLCRASLADSIDFLRYQIDHFSGRNFECLDLLSANYVKGLSRSEKADPHPCSEEA